VRLVDRALRMAAGAWSCLRAFCLVVAALPAIALEFRREALVNHANQDAGSSAADGLKGNPLLAMYRKWTLQYEKDAQEATSAAAYYAHQTKLLEEQVSAADVGDTMKKKLAADGVPVWAYAAWTVQGMLSDQTPVRAAAAAAEAAAPYNAAYAAYDKAKAQFNSAAVGYALRAKQDADLAHNLMSYANQFRLQGNTQQADVYKGQATSLMTQAEKFSGLADKDTQMAEKIYGVLPSIQGWAGKAGAAAAYDENPLGNLPAKDVFPFTVVPPAD